MPEFVVGSGVEHIRVEVLRREWPAADDYWDGNWLASRVAVRIGPWIGAYDAMFRAEDFVRFRESVEAMHRDLDGSARFFTMEPFLSIDLKIDAHGRVSVEGDAKPEGAGRVFGEVGLDFQLSDFIDQSFLPALIAQLREIESAFPVKGDPSS
jgi:hypothetical protein